MNKALKIENKGKIVKCCFKSLMILALLVSSGLIVGCGDEPKVEYDKDGKVEHVTDPVLCVHFYYKSIEHRDYTQYQRLVMSPMSKSDFANKVNRLHTEKRENDKEFVSAPVRKRTGEKEVDSSKRYAVTSISPWTDKEEKYEVIAQGQTWKIDKEK